MALLFSPSFGEKVRNLGIACRSTRSERARIGGSEPLFRRQGVLREGATASAFTEERPEDGVILSGFHWRPPAHIREFPKARLY